VEKPVVSSWLHPAGFQPSVPAFLETFPATEQGAAAGDVALPGFKSFVTVKARDVDGALAFRSHGTKKELGYPLGALAVVIAPRGDRLGG
jgi:hypothetical protein